MAKDALGHGSDGRDAQGFDANGVRPAKSGAPNRWDMKGTPIAELQAARARYADQQARYASVPGTKEGERDPFSVNAANALASGPKSAPVPVHDSMSGSYDANGVRPAMSGAPNRWDVKGEPTSDAQRAKSAAADSAMGFGSSTHNSKGHAWGSSEAIKDWHDGRAARGFASGKREINRLRK